MRPLTLQWLIQQIGFQQVCPRKNEDEKSGKGASREGSQNQTIQFEAGDEDSDQLF